MGEMTGAIIRNYLDTITPEDDVYILGDILMGGNDYFEIGLKMLNSLPGHIHLVRGNHDTNKRWSAYQEQCTWDLVEASNAIYLDYKHYHFYLSHYPTITSNNDYDKPLKARLLNLCGHTHTTDKWADADKGYIYHCEADAHNCKPVSLDEIIEDFKDMYEKGKNQDRQVKIDNKTILAEQTLFKTVNCNKCVWENFCEGPTRFTFPPKCPDGKTYKRDPPDGGYYG